MPSVYGACGCLSWQWGPLLNYYPFSLCLQNPDNQKRRPGARQLVRSSKKLPYNPENACNDFDDDDGASSVFSSSSWSTVASSVGGASLLSGVSCATSSVLLGTDTKKPWRQLTAAKKANREAGARKKKEKLRRVYVDLDRHEVQ